MPNVQGSCAVVVLFWAGISLAGADAKPPVADTVTLRDGKVVLGQVLDWSPQRGLRMVVRRAWADSKLPQWAARWDKAEAPEQDRARKLRRDRLARWKAERGGPDRVTEWIDKELVALDGAAEKSPLLLLRLPRTDVRSVKRADPKRLNALRLAWSAALADPEEKPFDELKDGLASRGLLADDPDPVDLSALLPLPAESNAEWLMRRAATEVLHDEGLRLIKHGSVLLPEPAAGAAPAPDAVLGAAKDLLRELIDGAPQVDPLLSSLRAIEGRQKVGAVVTELQMGAGAVRVGSTLWVRSADGWTPGQRRIATVDPSRLPAGAGDGLMADPQVSAIFKAVEGLGLGIDPEMKRTTLATGEASRRALDESRSALQKDLERLDLLNSATPPPKPKP